MTQENEQETQETVIETENNSDSSNELLHEVMAKKEKIGKLETQLADLTAKEDKRRAKEDKRRQDQLAKEGKKDELITELQNQVEQFKPFKERLETYETSRRATLIEKLPESKKEKFQNHPLDVLEDLVEEYSHKSPSVDNSSPSKMGGFASLVEWAQKDPASYKKENKKNKGITLGY
mgnify:CR=1